MNAYKVDFIVANKVKVTYCHDLVDARNVARKMSKIYDGAYVVSYDESGDIGHIPYVNGVCDKNAIEGILII